MGVGHLNVSYCYFGVECKIEKKTSCNLKMTLWDAKMALRILHFRLSSYQKHYFTVFNNYIYIILCIPRIAKIKRKILLGLKAQ